MYRYGTVSTIICKILVEISKMDKVTMAINFVSPFGTYPYRKTWHEVFFGTVHSIRYGTIFFLPSFYCALGTVPYKFSTSTGTVPYLSQVMRAIILHDKHLPTSEEYGTIPLPIGSML